jgi:U4/U6 small nuclear ribonucleoprotein PRP31
MSTLADELLQDFEDSGSEGEELENGNLFNDDSGLNGPAPNFSRADSGGMELDGDEEEVDEGDEDMAGMNNGTINALDDEEEAKAKVEKMHLGAVDDVRSVAGLMKTLEPVLEVSILQKKNLPPVKFKGLHLLSCS